MIVFLLKICSWPRLKKITMETIGMRFKVAPLHAKKNISITQYFIQLPYFTFTTQKRTVPGRVLKRKLFLLHIICPTTKSAIKSMIFSMSTDFLNCYVVFYPKQVLRSHRISAPITHKTYPCPATSHCDRHSVSASCSWS